eukprot:6490027-Amphidinium_carterae.1
MAGYGWNSFMWCYCGFLHLISGTMPAQEIGCDNKPTFPPDRQTPLLEPVTPTLCASPKPLVSLEFTGEVFQYETRERK